MLCSEKTKQPAHDQVDTQDDAEHFRKHEYEYADDDRQDGTESECHIMSSASARSVRYFLKLYNHFACHVLYARDRECAVGHERHPLADGGVLGRGAAGAFA